MITEVTRRDIVDFLAIEKIFWGGRLDDVEFLSRLYNLEDMPSTDSRFDNASGDIWQHTVNNPLDWEMNWVFFDERFSLLTCDDKDFLRFLCEMVHPVVRPDATECEKIVKAFNQALMNDGYKIIPEKTISGRNKYSFTKLSQLNMINEKIPYPIIATIAKILSDFYTHSELDNLLIQSNAPEIVEGNKLTKVQNTLKKYNEENKVDSFTMLGKFIESFMEFDCEAKEEHAKKDEIIAILAKHSLQYQSGGQICKVSEMCAAPALSDALKFGNLKSVEEEFQRTLTNIEKDPAASLTSACALLESVCKCYIEENGLALPQDKSVKPLWKVVAQDLNLTAAQHVDKDIKQILSGLSSIVHGVGSFRTHAGTAHGRGSAGYKIEPRHAYLAVNASHTLANFILRTWHKK